VVAGQEIFKKFEIVNIIAAKSRTKKGVLADIFK
jgi:hypothetical protein